MVGKTLDLYNVISADLLATRLTEKFIEWDGLRRVKKNDWEEIVRYVYQTDTTQTSNNQLPWKNKTTVPKICQILDNLYSNYTTVMFPQRKNVLWEGSSPDDNSAVKVKAITNYMFWVMSQPYFKHEMDKVLLDYIVRGNCFATVDWLDERVEQADKTQTGYVGPVIRRINPLDIVFNPTADSFQHAPKLVRSLISMGELKEMLERMSNDQNQETYQALYAYLKDIRFQARTFQGDWVQKDHLFQMDGFTSFRAYLQSDYCEVLTFYGDWYDYQTGEFQKNRIITVVDRHKLISNVANPSYFGYAPIFHVPWRKKTDNLWGMGPLDNLVGMQYRIDHVENMAADIWDLVTYPVQLIKGFVEDFVWQPGEKIFTSDEGSVELVTPDVNVMQGDMKIEHYKSQMEEMAGAPKEAMGFRTPGEKTKYEVQRLENAASRLFQNKIKQFEEQMLEPLLNAMLELARRNMSGMTTIRVLDDFSNATFQDLNVDDITGAGRIKPVAARHFAEQAELVQNLTNLAGSGLWPVVQPHISGIALATAFEGIFNLEDYKMIVPFIALAEQAEAQKRIQVLQEQVHQAAGTATGMNGDYDLSAAHAPVPAAPSGGTSTPFNLKRQPPMNAEPGGLLGTQ